MSDTCDKIVVFDLDETLGAFVELGIFWDALDNYFNNLTKNDFFDVLDLYPEFLRPNIISILNYLKHKKKSNICNKIMIYTNNQGPKHWSYDIKEYFEKRLNSQLFDQVICAFKVDGRQVEINRTTHNKTYSDLLRCTKIPKDAKICFLDDQEHKGMEHDMVYYINIKPYTHDLPYELMIQRFIDSKIPCSAKIDNLNDFRSRVLSHMKLYAYNVKKKDKLECELDRVISKRIMYHLQNFFKNAMDKTPKQEKNITIKKYKKSKKGNKIKKHRLKNKTVKLN